jgi:hypothetical protein
MQAGCTCPNHQQQVTVKKSRALPQQVREAVHVQTALRMLSTPAHAQRNHAALCQGGVAAQLQRTNLDQLLGSHNWWRRAAQRSVALGRTATQQTGPARGSRML